MLAREPWATPTLTEVSETRGSTTIEAETPLPTHGAFERFWTQYPRKVAKLAAQRAFAQTVKKGVDPEDILRGAMRYVAKCDGQDPKYIKHPATWLNAGCWADEPSPPGRQPQNRNPGVAFLLKIAGGNHD